MPGSPSATERARSTPDSLATAVCADFGVFSSSSKEVRDTSLTFHIERGHDTRRYGGTAGEYAEWTDRSSGVSLRVGRKPNIRELECALVPRGADDRVLPKSEP